MPAQVSHASGTQTHGSHSKGAQHCRLLSCCGNKEDERHVVQVMAALHKLLTPRTDRWSHALRSRCRSMGKRRGRDVKCAWEVLAPGASLSSTADGGAAQIGLEVGRRYGIRKQ